MALLGCHVGAGIPGPTTATAYPASQANGVQQDEEIIPRRHPRSGRRPRVRMQAGCGDDHQHPAAVVGAPGY